MISSRSMTPSRSCTAARQASISRRTSLAVARPSLTMKLACRLDTSAPPTAVPLRPTRSMSAPREGRHARRQMVASRVGILEHAARAGSRERLGPLAVGKRRARPPPQGRRLPRGDGELGPQHDLAGALQPTPVVPELERGSVDLHLAAARVRETGADEALAEQRALKVRVAVQAAAHRARGARPPFETGQTPVDRPAHEAVQRHAASGADHARAGALDGAVPQPHDEPPHAAVADQHVRPAAEQRDGQAETVAHRDGARRLAAAPRLQEPVGRASRPECRARVPA